MKSNRIIKEKACSLLKDYELIDPTLDDLVFIVNTFGFDVIDFAKDEKDENLRLLINELGVSDLVRTARAFVYQKMDVKLLFVDDSMTANEKKYAIAHELGHIVLGHLQGNTSQTADMKEEFEANEFAHYLLDPGILEKTVLQLRHWRKRRAASSPAVLYGVIIILFILVLILGIFSFRLWKERKGVSKDHFQMEIIDPLAYIDEGRIFGKEVAEYIEGLEEGKDYTITDVYGNQQVYAYAFHPQFTYFGIPEGSTGIRIFEEPNEGITMICYDFILPSADTERITQKLQAMMACIRQVYSRGYDFGRYYDPQENSKYINFDDFLNGIRQKNNGSYSITWVLDEYSLSLDFNYDENQEISLGSIRFYTPKEKSD